MERAFALILAALIGLFASASPAAAGMFNYLINQRYGSIGFSVSMIGLFTVDGHFTRFTGRLAIDQEHPTRTRIDVTLEAASAALASPEAVAMLRAPAYFDVAHYPAIHFVSNTIIRAGTGRFVIHGMLTIRGITHPQSLDATLVREKDLPNGLRIADFRVNGSLRRSAYGMTANENFVSDTVHLAIYIRLSLNTTAHES